MSFICKNRPKQFYKQHLVSQENPCKQNLKTSLSTHTSCWSFGVLEFLMTPSATLRIWTKTLFSPLASFWCLYCYLWLYLTLNHTLFMFPLLILNRQTLTGLLCLSVNAYRFEIVFLFFYFFFFSRVFGRTSQSCWCGFFSIVPQGVCDQYRTY